MTEVISHTLQDEVMIEEGGAVEIHASYLVVLDSNVSDVIPVISQSGIPGIGTPHPSYQAAYCVRRQAQAIDPQRFNVSTVWRQEMDERPGGVCTIGSGMSNFKDSVDIDGNRIYTTFFYGETIDKDTPWWGQQYEINHEVEKRVPVTILRWTRTSSNWNTAFSRTVSANGHVNSADWFGIPPRFAICTRADIQVVNYAARKFREVYEFSFRPNGANTAPNSSAQYPLGSWDAIVSHTKADTKEVVDTVKTQYVTPDGQSVVTVEPRKGVRIYQEYDFNNLDLEILS